MCYSPLTYIIWFSRTHGLKGGTQTLGLRLHKQLLSQDKDQVSAHSHSGKYICISRPTEFAVSPPIFSAVIFKTSTKGYFHTFDLAHD